MENIRTDLRVLMVNENACVNLIIARKCSFSNLQRCLRVSIRWNV